MRRSCRTALFALATVAALGAGGGGRAIAASAGPVVGAPAQTTDEAGLTTSRSRYDVRRTLERFRPTGSPTTSTRVTVLRWTTPDAPVSPTC